MSAFISALLIIMTSWEVSGTTRCPNYQDFQNGSIVRPVVKFESNNLCFWSFDQGPCQRGEWLRFNEDIQNSTTTRIGYCELRQCPENLEENTNDIYPSFYFQHKGTCYKSNTVNVNYCGNAIARIYFTEDDDEPTCRKSASSEDPNGRGLFDFFIYWGPVKSMRRGYLYDN